MMTTETAAEPTGKHVLIDDHVNGQPFRVYGKPGSLLGWRLVEARGGESLVEVNGQILPDELLAQGWVDTDEFSYEAWSRGIRLRQPGRFTQSEQQALQEARAHVDSAHSAYATARKRENRGDDPTMSYEMQLGVALLIAVDRLLTIVENAEPADSGNG